MTTEEIYTTMRDTIRQRDANLAKVAENACVPYNRIYRFMTDGAMLSLIDTEKLWSYLFDKPLFHQTSDDEL
jgi:hypothetical protein